MKSSDNGHDGLILPVGLVLATQGAGVALTGLVVLIVYAMGVSFADCFRGGL